MRQIRFKPFLLAIITVVSITIASQSEARAQNQDWVTFSPEGDDFTIVMPRDPKFEAGDETYHRMTLHTRLYVSAVERGPVLAVASLSGIKSNPAMYSEFQRLNSYVDAFKNWFPAKVRKAAVAKLTLVGEKTLNGNQGREYHVVIGDLSGTARVYATRKRFYAAVILGLKNDEKLTENFLSSFVIPEKVTEQPATVASGGPPMTTDPALNPALQKRTVTDDSKPDAAAGTNGEAKPGEAKPGEPTTLTQPAQPGERAPISGGVLNNKALSLPQPESPANGNGVKVLGTVVVQILVDEAGNVINAHATSGPPLLQSAAVAAARLAKFSPTSLMGEPVKVTGVLTYNFR
jgi:TonB family protein